MNNLNPVQFNFRFLFAMSTIVAVSIWAAQNSLIFVSILCMCLTCLIGSIVGKTRLGNPVRAGIWTGALATGLFLLAWLAIDFAGSLLRGQRNPPVEASRLIFTIFLSVFYVSFGAVIGSIMGVIVWIWCGIRARRDT